MSFASRRDHNIIYLVALRQCSVHDRHECSGVSTTLPALFLLGGTLAIGERAAWQKQQRARCCNTCAPASPVASIERWWYMSLCLNSMSSYVKDRYIMQVCEHPKIDGRQLQMTSWRRSLAKFLCCWSKSYSTKPLLQKHLLDWASTPGVLMSRSWLLS